MLFECGDCVAWSIVMASQEQSHANCTSHRTFPCPDQLNSFPPTDCMSLVMQGVQAALESST